MIEILIFAAKLIFNLIFISLSIVFLIKTIKHVRKANQ